MLVISTIQLRCDIAAAFQIWTWNYGPLLRQTDNNNAVDGRFLRPGDSDYSLLDPLPGLFLTWREVSANSKGRPAEILDGPVDAMMQTVTYHLLSPSQDCNRCYWPACSNGMEIALVESLASPR